MLGVTISQGFEKEIALAVKVTGKSEQDLELRIKVVFEILRAAGVEFRMLQEIQPGINRLP